MPGKQQVSVNVFLTPPHDPHTPQQWQNAADAAEDVKRRGYELYAQSIRAEIVPEHTGRCLVVDVISGDYETSDREYEASRRLLDRRPEGMFYSLRIGGFPEVYRTVTADGADRTVSMS